MPIDQLTLSFLQIEHRAIIGSVRLCRSDTSLFSSWLQTEQPANTGKRSIVSIDCLTFIHSTARRSSAEWCSIVPKGCLTILKMLVDRVSSGNWYHSIMLIDPLHCSLVILLDLPLDPNQAVQSTSAKQDVES